MPKITFFIDDNQPGDALVRLETLDSFIYFRHSRIIVPELQSMSKTVTKQRKNLSYCLFALEKAAFYF